MVMCTLLNLKRITNVAHGNLLNVIFSLNGRGLRGRIDTCICMAESYPCSLETITLLIGYTSIQNEKFKGKRLERVSNDSDTNLDFKELAVTCEKYALIQHLFTEDLPCVMFCAKFPRHGNK